MSQMYRDWMDWMGVNENGLYLKDGAPEEVIQKFKEYMKEDEDGVIT